MSTARLLELHDLAKDECRRYARRRFLYEQMAVDEGRHFTGIVGPRGAGKLVVEVGGKGKGREQFKGINVDRKLVFAHTDVPDGRRLPLFLAGFLV